MSVEWSEIPEKHPEESLYNAAPIFYDQTEANKNDRKWYKDHRWKLLSGKEQPHNNKLQIVSISQSSQKGKTLHKQYLQMGPCITVNH